MGFRVQGLGLRGARVFRVQALGFREGSRFWGLGFGVWGLGKVFGFRVLGF